MTPNDDLKIRAASIANALEASRAITPDSAASDTGAGEMRDIFERPFDGDDDPRLQLARCLTRKEAEANFEQAPGWDEPCPTCNPTPDEVKAEN